MTDGNGKRLAALVALLGLGAAAGFALEEALISRKFRPDADQDEPFGELHGETVEVIADDGVRLHVEVDEPPTPTPDDLTIIFSHGYALNEHCWHFQRRDLRPLGRLVFFDQRAHGLSTRGESERSTIDQLGMDLGRIIDAVAGSGPIVLVGHSMGGMTVMALAAHRPELFDDKKVAGVALLATAVGGLKDSVLGMPPMLGRALHQAAPTVLGLATRHTDLVEAGRQRGSDFAYLLAKYYSFGSNVPPSLTNFTADMTNGTPVDVVAEFLPGLDAHEKSEALMALRDIETLVMVGDKDRLTPPPHSEEIIRRVPHAQYVLLQDTGHMLILERHAEVNQAIRDLVARVREQWNDASR